MILLLKKKKICNLNLYNINLKYKNNNLYLQGKYGNIKLYIIWNKINIILIKNKILNLYNQLNNGWIGILFLNGLGFKSTKKIIFSIKKYWRFNVGHSQVFQYFTPKNIILKSKNRYICIFGLQKTQVFDITQKIRKFHIPDIYKGIGIKYPNEIIKLKKGKVRQ